MADPSLSDAYAVGRRYEDALDDDARRRGAHYTPPDVAEMLVDRALRAWGEGDLPVVCDPSCGGGVFLVAAAEALRRRGASPEAILDRLVVGNDVDPDAAEAARAALRTWASGHGDARARRRGAVEPRVLVGDALDASFGRRVGRVDVVVGNPPFQNQLGGATARTPSQRAALVDRFGSAASGYVDIAALFQLACVELVAAGGVVTLIQPRSFLVARDAVAVRDELLARGRLEAVWLPGVAVFAANVDVCATVIRRAGDPAVDPAAEVVTEVAVWTGRSAERTAGAVSAGALAGAPTWSPVWGLAHGVPKVEAPAGADEVSSVATTTAGFRDQYYGLLDHIRDDEPSHGAPLVTTAMVEPGRCEWGRRTVTIARRRRATPWVDLDALAASDASVSAWVSRLRVPKVLVATQTKVVEATPDPTGVLVPLTPVIAVVPTAGLEVHHLVAALTAPATTAWALTRYGGGGLSSGALKLAANQVAQVPLPVDRAAWADGVALLTALLAAGAPGGRDRWRAFGRTMNAAWRLDDEALLEWWLDRLGAKVDRSPDDSIH